MKLPAWILFALIFLAIPAQCSKLNGGPFPTEAYLTASVVCGIIGWMVTKEDRPD